MTKVTIKVNTPRDDLRQFLHLTYNVLDFVVED